MFILHTTSGLPYISWLISIYSNCRKQTNVFALGVETNNHAYIYQRLKEQKRALTSGNLAQSAIGEHAMEEMYLIDRKEVQVVDSHPHYTQQCILEAWHIRLEKNNLNRDVRHPPITPSFIPLNPPQSCSPPFTTYVDPGL